MRKAKPSSNLSQLRRSIINNFKEETSNPHPELKKKKSKSSKSTTPSNRRDKRKLAKRLKKARRVAYATKVPLADLYAEILHPKKVARDATSMNASDDKVFQTPKKSEPSESEKFQKRTNPEQRRIEDARQRLKEDEREIKLYAKKLKLNKRKSKSLPKSFVDDGLGYLLEICGAEKRGKVSNNDISDNEASYDEDNNDSDQPMSDFQSDVEEDAEIIATPELPKNKKRVRFSEKAETEEADPKPKDGENESDGNEVDEEDEEISSLREDIYGRLRDKQGNVIQSHQSDKRSNASSESSAKTDALKKLFRSLINRLGESTVQSAVAKVQEAYASYSRNDVKEILKQSIFSSCIRTDKIPDRLILEHCLFLALIHAKVSIEITSHFVEYLAFELKKLRENVSKNTEDKTLDNVASLFSYLFTLKVVHHKLIFDILQYLIDAFEEKDIELILLILQAVGFVLRKENPAELKSIIDKVHLKSASVDLQNFSNRSRVQFMLDTLQSIKNNNALKVGNYDPELAEHFFKILRGSMNGKPLESPLPMGLSDLWSASKNGRWWIVGSAVVVPDVHQHAGGVESDQRHKPVVDIQFSDELLALAKKNRMNTELRRNIFCILMSSEDYLDAFEKLTKLSLKNQQEREIVHICLACCLKEKLFNPFYVYLVHRFCTNQPKFILTSQFAIWDKLKTLDDLSDCEIKNLASFLSHLMVTETLPLPVLKVIDFGQMQGNCVQFLTVLFTKFLTSVNDDILKTVFTDLIKQKNFRSVLEGLKLFLQTIFPKQLSEKQRVGLSKKINIVDRLLYYSADSFL